MSNKFQILDKAGEPVPLNTIDKIAAKFWGVELQKSNYCSPIAGINMGDWFNIIGWPIANQGHYTKGWANVLHTMVSESFSSKFVDDKKLHIIRLSEEAVPIKTDEVKTVLAKLEGVFIFFQPYVALIRHLNELGYTPKKLKG